MTENMKWVVERAARSAITSWGGGEEELSDLIQDLWVWYYERPGTQAKLAEMAQHEALASVRGVALQILSEKVLEGNTFQGRDLYSSESVKDVLKGRSSNVYLRQIVPLAINALADVHAEAVRSRYDDGTIPAQGGQAVLLAEAHKALTAQVNIIVISAEGVGKNAMFPELRKKQGAHGDPTADVAITLMEKGDEEHDITEEDGTTVIGTTTLRKEFNTDALSIFDSVLDDDSRADPDVMEQGFNGNDRTEMYRAWVFPELFPDEKQPLIENWSQEDREMYCGGEYTVGYRRLTVVK